jgi:hypothetical protein
MAVSHIDHVILASHLLSLLKSTAPSGNTVRISVQCSNAHEMSPKDTKFASLDELNQDLGLNQQYDRSKLARILYTRYLTRLLPTSHPKILANTTRPGFVETKISVDDIHEPFPGMSVFMAPLKKNQWQRATSTLFCATTIAKSGEYLCLPATPEPGSELARNEELGEQLMRLTRGVDQGEGWGGQCGQKVSVEELLGRLDVGEVDMNDWRGRCLLAGFRSSRING